MATAGIYKLLINDGKQDRILMATDLLNKRLLALEKEKKNNITLCDIEKTHLFHINRCFKPFVAIGYEYDNVYALGKVGFNQKIKFSIPQFGDFFHDMVLHVRFSSLKALDVNEYSSSPTTPNTRDKVRWCSFPGEKLIKTARFTVNGNYLDEYDSDDYVFYRLFHLQSEARSGWDRMMGQEQAIPGRLIHSPGVDEVAENRSWYMGHQTWKNSHEELDLWIPLLFWFNLDSALSIPSVSIPYGQRFIEIELETLANLVEVQQNGGSGKFSTPQFEKCELYINNIFVNPEIHDIFIKRIGFTMIRVHLQQKNIVKTSQDKIILNKLKYPIETIYMGLRPLENENSCENWHLFSKVEQQNRNVPVVYDPPGGPPGTGLGISSAFWNKTSNLIQSLEIQAHGVQIYKDISGKFYNTYLPWARKNHTPDEPGALMIPFALHPGKYQPSGHLNASRSREFYVHLTCTEEPQARLITKACALNFLLISDGSAVLRYST